MLLFSDVAAAFSDIEKRSGRLEMTDILSNLFRKTGKDEIDMLVYIIQGMIAPPFEGLDLGLGEKFAIEAIASAAGYSKSEVEAHYKKSGDLGDTAEALLSRKRQTALFTSEMDLRRVYEVMRRIAESSGTGSQEQKIKRLAEMLNNASPLEARYIVRFVLGRLRLGVGDPTIIDALSVWKAGDKSLREPLERAYNVCSDLGYVAKSFFARPGSIGKFKVKPFKPLMPALAERLSDPKAIIERLGRCGVEMKYDGFRCISGYTQLYIKNKGLLSARDVAIGDYVLTHNGRFRKILAKNIRTINKGERVYRIQTFFGNEFKITEGHPILASQGDKARWINVEDIPADASLVFPLPNLRHYSLFPKKITLQDCGYTKSILLDKDFFRFLGFWIGDGYTNDYHNTERIGLIFNKKTEMDLCRSYESIIRKKFRISDISRSPLRGAMYLYWRDKPLRIWLSRNFRREWKGKMLPEWFVNIPKKHYLEFLKGWLEADGHEEGGRKIIITKERDLAMLAQLIGLKHKILIGIKRFRVKGRDYYQVRLTKDARKARIRNNFVHVKLLRKEIVKVNPRFRVYNFQVEKDESFCVPMLVLHNCQIHKDGDKVEIYSRKLERMTPMFPDIVEAVARLPKKELIFEGEALAYDEEKRRYFPFQTTMHRRRKHGIGEASKEFPLNLFVFDILYIDGEDMTGRPYSERRDAITRIFREGILRPSMSTVVEDPEVLERMFQEAIAEGLEGIMAKDLSSPYNAGKRKFAWIKLKKSYGKAVDTIDGVIVGYYLGRGSRAEFEFGGVLLAVFNPDSGKLETIAKMATGFSEAEMKELQAQLEGTKTDKPPINLDCRIEVDFWVEPRFIVEVAFDEITQSPNHTCGWSGGKGYALRFPRLVRMRPDKGIHDITTTSEVIEMFQLQREKGAARE